MFSTCLGGANDPIFALAYTPAFSDLKLFYHARSHIPGTDSWAAEVGDVTVKLTTTSSLRDADGVYSSIDQNYNEPIGTMPTVSQYVVPFAVGRFASDQDNVGLVTEFGYTSAGNMITVYGRAETVESDSAHVQVGEINLGQNGARGCVLGYIDCVSSADPTIFRVLANEFGETRIYYGEMVIGSNLQAMGTAPLNSYIYNAATILGVTRAGARSLMYGIFDFANPFTPEQMVEAALFMAQNYGRLWPGFSNP